MLALLLLLACDHGFADPAREFAAPVSEDATLHAVTIHAPETLGVVDTPIRDVHGTPIGVACETCHDGDDPLAGDSGNPEQVHGEIDLQHGSLGCDFCHDPSDRSRLRLADGSSLAMGDAMDLCSQCHGVQRRDYDRGSHGGMSGHWDLRQGPRTRNHCLDCHAAHAPTYQGVMPAFYPLDLRKEHH